MTEKERETEEDLERRPGQAAGGADGLVDTGEVPDITEEPSDLTVILPEDVEALEPESGLGDALGAGAPGSADPAKEATGVTAGPEGTETEVFVLLPELADMEIPMVKTEVVAEGSDRLEGLAGASEATLLDDATDATDVEVDDATQVEDATEAPAGEAGQSSEGLGLDSHPASKVDTANLDEVVSDLEDELLSSEGDLSGEAADEGAAVLEEEEAAGAGALEGEATTAQLTGKRALRKLVLPLAAAILLGLGLTSYLVYSPWSGFNGGACGNRGDGSGDPLSSTAAGGLTGGSTAPASGTGSESTGGGAEVAAVVGLPPTGGEAAALKEPVTSGTSGGEGGERDPGARSRELFREKLLVAIELGFALEVDHE